MTIGDALFGFALAFAFVGFCFCSAWDGKLPSGKNKGDSDASGSP